MRFRVRRQFLPFSESAQLISQLFVKSGVAFGTCAKGKQAVGGMESHLIQRVSDSASRRFDGPLTRRLASLPLNCRGRLAGNIIHHPIDSFHLIYDAI